MMRQIEQLIVFAVTFISYGLFHASRKTLSGVKSSITADWMHSSSNSSGPFIPSKEEAESLLGLLDSLFMAAYAISMFYWGWLGDRLNPRNVLALGMVGSAAALVAFGSLPKWFGFYSVPYYILTYLIFGLLQACGWPNEVAIMGNWFGRGNRGFILGLWASCQPVGNIVGSLLISLILPLGYQYTFALNSLLMVLGAFVVAFTIKESPRDERYSSTDQESIINSDSVPSEDTARVGFFQALCLPNVLPYCLCNACLKFVNYAFFFWLPLYLTAKYGWAESDANRLSIWYDVGGILGSVAGGFVSDRLGCRSPVIVVMLIISLGALFLYSCVGNGALINAVVMFVVGITISGPYNLIVGTISVDLGTQPVLSSNAQAMATVSGLVDGTGSAGSAVGQFVIPAIENHFGWNYVFYMFIAMNGLAIACLTRKFLSDVALLCRRIPASASERAPLLSSEN